MNGKIPEGQVYAPRLEPTAAIRLADRSHPHYYIISRTRVIPRTFKALGKCTNGVAFSKGRPNLASVRLTL